MIEMRVVLAILNIAADVIDQLDNGTGADAASFHSVIELSSEHRVLSIDRIGEQEAVTLLRAANELDIQNLDQRLRVDVAGVDSLDRIRR